VADPQERVRVILSHSSPKKSHFHEKRVNFRENMWFTPPRKMFQKKSRPPPLPTDSWMDLPLAACSSNEWLSARMSGYLTISYDEMPILEKENVSFSFKGDYFMKKFFATLRFEHTTIC